MKVIDEANIHIWLLCIYSISSIASMEPAKDTFSNRYITEEMNWWKHLCKKSEEKNISPLIFVCQYCYGYASDIPKVLTFLKNNNLPIDINQQDKESLRTPLHHVNTYYKDDLVAELLKIPDIDINIQDKKGHTPLYIASIHCDLEDKRVDMLLATDKANFLLKDNQGRTIVDFALRGYTHYWETCDNDSQDWPFENIERRLVSRELTMHKIMNAAPPLSIEPIIKILNNMPIIYDIKCFIAHKLYQLFIELIAAKKYRNEESYYKNHWNWERQETKWTMSQYPTKEDIRLLWR